VRPVTKDPLEHSLEGTRPESIVKLNNPDPALVQAKATVMRAQLIPAEGGTPIEISRDLTVVGRQEDCDLWLDHKSVSKIHCVIVKTDGLLLLRDLGSTNGTRVNGQRVRRAALLPNDQLNIANCKFTVYLGPDDPATQAAPAKKAPLEIEEEDSDSDFNGPQQASDLPDIYPIEAPKPAKT
jgi:pSer/pThr/pTyr-binding forkhead associated (FHA) protein